MKRLVSKNDDSYITDSGVSEETFDRVYLGDTHNYPPGMAQSRIPAREYLLKRLAMMKVNVIDSRYGRFLGFLAMTQTIYNTEQPFFANLPVSPDIAIVRRVIQ